MDASCDNHQYIVVFGTVSLQRYIFQSNRLKENIGASYLAKHWLSNGLVETVEADTTDWDKYIDKPLGGQDRNKDISLIYIGGGNTALLCESQQVATNAVRTWSHELLKKAPELRVAVGYGKVNGSLSGAYREALKDLAQCEEALRFGTPLYGLPVTRTCSTTGLPATEDASQDEWISRAAACKRGAVGTQTNLGDAQKTIAKEFEQVLAPDINRAVPQQRFAIELEDLGGYEGQSYIAVVHADGNRIGEKRMNVIKENANNNEEFLRHIREFSASVTQRSQSALKATLEHLKAALPLKSFRNPEDVFPLRPIVYGGDDLTFICDGRLGLDLTEFYLKEFAKGGIKVCGRDQNVDACAGVAIVPTKFPFAEAYNFADQLCGLAKWKRRIKGNSKGSWIDFQIVQEGATRSITALREVQYRSLSGQVLHQRPYQVPEEWDDFIEILKGFQSTQWPRSRAKNLLQALVQGPAATERFVNEMELPKTKNTDDIAQITGWKSEDDEKQSTPYFDPLNALDFYVEAKPAPLQTISDEKTKDGDKP